MRSRCAARRARARASRRRRAHAGSGAHRLTHTLPRPRPTACARPLLAWSVVENALVDDPELLGPPSQLANDDLPPRDQFLRALGVADSKAAGLLRVLLATVSYTHLT